MWRRDRRRPEQELVAECEAFLAGRYAEHVVAGFQRPPAWAWTNLLAHGTEEQLRDCPTEARTGHWEDERWCDARRYLAGEVLVASGRGVPLAAMQARLVELELRLAASADGHGDDPSPAAWVDEVLDLLAAEADRARRTRRRDRQDR